MKILIELKKNKLLAIFLALSFLFIILLSPKKMIKDPSDYLLSGIYYNGIDVTKYINKDSIANILMKYNKRISLRDYFPYVTSDVIVEINGYNRGEPLHIILGNYFICYRSGDGFIYKIINGEELLNDITMVLNRINLNNN